MCGGLLSTSSKRIVFSIPCHTCAEVATITKLDVVVRPVEGAYPYMKYGNNASSSIQLGSSNTTIWENSAEKYANSISSISATIHSSYIIIQIDFVNSLVTTSGGSTSIKTSTTIFITAVPTLKFS